MQRDRMLLLVIVVGVALAAAVAALVSPPLAVVPLLVTGAAVVVLRRSAAGADDWDDEEDDEHDGGHVARASDGDDGYDDYDSPADSFATWQPEGGLSTWQPPVSADTYADDAADPYAADAAWDSSSSFDSGDFGDQQEYEPLPTWGTFVVGEVVEEVSSSDDILVASQQSALAVTEDLSEEDVQRVNQELLSRVHSLLAKYD